MKASNTQHGRAGDGDSAPHSVTGYSLAPDAYRELQKYSDAISCATGAVSFHGIRALAFMSADRRERRALEHESREIPRKPRKVEGRCELLAWRIVRARFVVRPIRNQR